MQNEELLLEGRSAHVQTVARTPLYIGVSICLLIFGFLIMDKYKTASILLIASGSLLLLYKIYQSFQLSIVRWQLLRKNDQLMLLIKDANVEETVTVPFDYELSYSKDHIKANIYKYTFYFSFKTNARTEYTLIQDNPAGEMPIRPHWKKHEGIKDLRYAYMNSNGFYLMSSELTLLEELIQTNIMTMEDNTIADAISHYDVATFKSWLENTEDPNTIFIPGEELQGVNTLQYIVMSIDEPKDDAALVEMAQLLIEKGADVNVAASEWSNTPLATAFSRVNLPMIELLLKHGADPYAFDPDMGSTIHNIPPELDESTSEKIFSLIEKYKKPA